MTNMPKIWKLEDKVVGADLGKGTFQFNFQSEEDLQGVLQNAPYHFDGWMVVLVRWEPIISSTYPSAINFWVKISGIPMHLWEEATLEAVGKKVGLTREIDVDSGSFHATVNGFNPLVFQMVYLVESHCSSGGLANFYNVRINFEFYDACIWIIDVQVLIGEKMLVLFLVYGDTIEVGISSLFDDWVYLKNIQGNEDHNPTYQGSVKGYKGGRNPPKLKVDK